MGSRSLSVRVCAYTDVSVYHSRKNTDWACLSIMCVTLFFRPRGAFYRIATSKKTGLLVVMFKELNAKRHLTVPLKKEKPERWDKQRTTLLVCNVMCLWHEWSLEERRKKRDSGLNFKMYKRRAGKHLNSHVAVGVDATIFLHILHLCWVNMLNLLNSLRLAK